MRLNSRNWWKALTQSITTGNSEPKPSPSRQTAGRDMAKKKGGIKLTILPLTPDLWPALGHLFGIWGASDGCWCMYWRIGGAYHGRCDQNKETLRKIVKRGSPPGLVAFDHDLAVGWCQLTPRDALPWLDRMWWFQRVDDVPVWSISCFFVRRAYRRQATGPGRSAQCRLLGAERIRLTACEPPQPGHCRQEQAQWTGEAGHLPVTMWAGLRDG
jgi:hypothetical protein